MIELLQLFVTTQAAQGRVEQLEAEASGFAAELQSEKQERFKAERLAQVCCLPLSYCIRSIHSGQLCCLSLLLWMQGFCD